MQDKETIKKKNDLFKSMMKNPKMSKAFKDAMSSPIGSTKREQGRSLFSIMKKVGGIKNDGMGGPVDTANANPYFPTSTNSSASSYNSDNSNLMIFPSAPKFKTNKVAPVNTTVSTSKNLFNSNTNLNPNNIDFSKMGLKLGSDGGDTSALTNFNKDQKKGSLFNVGAQPKTLGGVNLPSSNSIFNPNQTAFGNSPSLNPSASVLEKLKNFDLQIKPTPLKTRSAFAGVEDTATGLEGFATDENGKYLWEYDASGKLVGWLTKKRQKEQEKEGTERALFKKRDERNAPKIEEPNLEGETPILDKIGSGLKSGGTGPADGATNAFNIAAKSVASLLNLNPNSAFAQDLIVPLAGAISTNEGYWNGTSKVAIKNNNPGNLKYVGQKGATEDDRGFAVFQTPEEGAQALVNDLTIKYNSGKYATINDLMSVYSPDSDNPASPTYGGGDTGSSVYGDLSKYSNLGGGSYAFAEDLAMSNFGDRRINQVLADNTAAFKEALTPLELELSRLNSMSPNFVSTMTDYIKGKDQYLKFIDSMIEQTEGQLMDEDMGDPNVAARYNNYMGYLTTLKGRQNERYGNYLNSAIDDYNAEVQTAQDNVDTFTKDAGDILNQQNLIDTEIYNSIMSRGESAYKEIMDAEEKEVRLDILKGQKLEIDIKNGVSGLEAGVYDEDYFKKKKVYGDEYLIQDKDNYDGYQTLDPIKIGPDGLINLYGEVAQTGSDANFMALTSTISIGFKNAIKNSDNPTETMAEVKKSIEELRNSGYENSEKWADNLTDSVFSQNGVNEKLSETIKTNINEIEKAAKDLVSGYGGFLGLGRKAPGLQDKETWMDKYDSLDSSLLESLYYAISTAIQPGTAYEEDPMSYVKGLFSADDETNATNLAKRITTSS